MATRSVAFTRSRSSSSTSLADTGSEARHLTLVRANEQALAAEQRYIMLNMNRLFTRRYGDEVDRTCYEFLRTQQLKPLLQNLRLLPRFPFGPVCPGSIPGRRAQSGRLLCRAGHRANHYPLEQVFSRRDRRRRGYFRRLSRGAWRRPSNRARISRSAQSTVSYRAAISHAAAARHDRTDRRRSRSSIRWSLTCMLL